MVTMDIDPGYAVVGYGMVSTCSGKCRSMGYSMITTQAGGVFRGRLVLVYDSTCIALIHNRSDTIPIGKLYFTNSRTIAIDVTEACGVILLAVHRVGVSTFECAPLQVKQTVTGYG